MEIRRFIANNAALFEHISAVELRQLEYQKDTDRKLDEIFTYIADHAESEQKLFFEGQIYDAFSRITSIIRKAEKSIRAGRQLRRFIYIEYTFKENSRDIGTNLYEV